MNFYGWHTDYDDYRSCTPKPEQRDYDDYISRRIYRLNKSGNRLDGVLAEDEWIKLGRPYYNIHPKLVTKLTKVNLEKIPSHLIQMPHNFHCINIRFAEQNDSLTLEDTIERLSQKYGVDIPVGSWVHSMMVIDSRKRANATNVVTFILDFNLVKYHDGWPTRSYIIHAVDVDPNVNLQQALELTAAITDHRQGGAYKLAVNSLKLAVSMGFLANSDADWIEYDVISKYGDEFAKASPERRNEIIQKSRNRGKIGYNVGNDLMFLGPRRLQENSDTQLTGRELQYAHIRDGHPHAIRYGKGRKLVKIKWFKPIVVREDLPFREDK